MIKRLAWSFFVSQAPPSPPLLGLLPPKMFRAAFVEWVLVPSFLDALKNGDKRKCWRYKFTSRTEITVARVFLSRSWSLHFIRRGCRMRKIGCSKYVSRAIRHDPVTKYANSRQAYDEDEIIPLPDGRLCRRSRSDFSRMAILRHFSSAGKRE